jgi:hypothetical protein
MTSQADTNPPEVISYYQLRVAIGVIGIALPFALMIGESIVKFLFPDARGPQHSMSEYFYTSMRGVFVGSLCAIGVFMGSYRGYDRRDRVAGWFACICAIGVALFPVNPIPNYPDWRHFIGVAHYAFAATLFSTLGYFCLALFTMHKPRDAKTPAKPMTAEKKQRNLVYKVCGLTIFSCIAGIAISQLLFLNDWSPFKNDLIINLAPVYWLEALAVVSFGLSWLVKGELILRDDSNSA